MQGCHGLTMAAACVRVADERDTVQKKTFTKWVNKHLIRVSLCCHGNCFRGTFLRQFNRIYVWHVCCIYIYIYIPVLFLH